MKDEIYPKTETYVCVTSEQTFALGEQLGAALKGGEAVLLEGGLGAGKLCLLRAR